MAKPPITYIEPKPTYPQVEEAEFKGKTVRVGDTVKMNLPGQRAMCVVKVTRIDLQEAEGAIRDVTVELWNKKGGSVHPQRGLTRTISPDLLDQYL